MLENGIIVELAARTAGKTQTVNHITTSSLKKVKKVVDKIRQSVIIYQSCC